MKKNMKKFMTKRNLIILAVLILVILLIVFLSKKSGNNNSQNSSSAIITDNKVENNIDRELSDSTDLASIEEDLDMSFDLDADDFDL